MDFDLLIGIDDIYRRYGFEINKKIKGVRAYEYNQGRYFGVDLLKIEKERDLDKIKLEYQKSGYAVIEKTYATLNEVENELFKSFFQVNSLRQNLLRKYHSFSLKQIQGLPDGSVYEYITSKFNYTFYNTFGELLENKDYDADTEDRSLMLKIFDLINTHKGPLLILIEAAAGYGKTCTAYEILNKFHDACNGRIPFFTELSRNREARIFKHILQNEIEEQFANVVKSDVVVHEIKSGNVPLIIDGFDELLSKEFEFSQRIQGDVESMLSTIIKLLERESKIIITTRRTAIFSGEEFYNWIVNSENKFSVARFSISEPSIRNWLPSKRVEKIQKYKMPVSEIGNPVVLAYLKNLNDNEFEIAASGEASLVDKYFDFILNREVIRQNLPFDSETQLRIFRKLARLLTEFDIKYESKVLIKELIKEYNKKIIDEAIKKMNVTPKPSLDEMVDTLSNHALLDRKENEQVGFINDFVLGALIGQSLILGKFEEHNKIVASTLSQAFTSLAIQSYKVQLKEERLKLHGKIISLGFPYSNEFFFNSDVSLAKKITRNYGSILIDDLQIEDIDFDQNFIFSQCMFNNCVFKNCQFSCYSFQDESSFVNCTFFDCIWIEKDLIPDFIGFHIIGSDSSNDFIDRVYKNGSNDISELNVINIEEEVLNLYFKKDGVNASMRRVSQIIDELSQLFGKKDVIKQLQRLKNDEILIINGNMSWITRNGIAFYNRKYRK